MKKHYANVGAFLTAPIFVLALLLNGTLSAQQDSKGTEFWLAFMGNNSTSGNNDLFFSSDDTTTGVVSIPGVGFVDTFTVVPGVITTVNTPNTAEISSSNVVENKGIHVTSNSEVTVYGLNQLSATTDAFLGLPVDILGQDHFIMGYRGDQSFAGRSEFAVVATVDNTQLTITPSFNSAAGPAGVPFIINLNEGQTYQLRGSSTVDDVTGTRVQSNQPVSVFGGAQCTNIKGALRACDHLVEQIPPVTTLGKQFVSLPLATRLNGDTYRFLATEDNTIVNVNGAAVDTLDAGEFHENIYAGALEINANNPILVAQFSNSSDYDNVTSDPFMMLIPPFEQYLGSYTLGTPTSGFVGHYINIIVPNAGVGNVVLDGAIIPAGNFSAIGASGFSGTTEQVAAGSHNVSSNFPVGVHSYGFGSFDSYGYPGGQGLSQVAIIDSLVLTSNTPAPQAGIPNCMQAGLYDDQGNPVPGVRIDFFVNGSNTVVGFSNTNAAGIASFCYTPTASGIDSIEARSGALSDTIINRILPGVPNACALSLSETHTDANDSVGGAIDLTIVGQQGPVTINWTGPSGFMSAMEDISMLASGNYMVVVEDSAGCKDSLMVFIDSVADDCVPLNLVCESDNTWMKSTTVQQAPWGGTWAGANSLPAAATYTVPVSIGQPYGYHSIEEVDDADVIIGSNNVTFYRKELNISNPKDVEMHLRMTMDDGAEIYLNGQLLLREANSNPDNWHLPEHNILYNSDGTIDNGHNGGQMFDMVTMLDLDSVLQAGANELVVALYNLRGSSNKGGFSLKLEATVQCPATDSCVSDSTWDLSTVYEQAPWGGVWSGASALPADSTYTLKAMEGMPYPWGGLYVVPGSQPIKAEHNVRFYRKCFEVTDKKDVDARIRMFMDDGAEVYLNGHLLAREENSIIDNWYGVPHDIQFNADGSVDNGANGNQAFDYASGADLDTILQDGTNCLVIALYNLRSSANKGGFSFRMDMTKGGAPVLIPIKSTLRSTMKRSDLAVYPNPASNWVNVEIDRAEQSRSLSLQALNGQVLETLEIGKDVGEYRFDLSAYPAGVYLLRLESEGELSVAKVMKY